MGSYRVIHWGQAEILIFLIRLIRSSSEVLLRWGSHSCIFGECIDKSELGGAPSHSYLTRGQTILVHL